MQSRNRNKLLFHFSALVLGVDDCFIPCAFVCLWKAVLSFQDTGDTAVSWAMKETHPSVIYPFFLCVLSIGNSHYARFFSVTHIVYPHPPRELSRSWKVWQLIVGKKESLGEKPLAIPDGKECLIFPSKSRGGDIFILTSVICCSCQHSTALPRFRLQLSLTGGSESVDGAWVVISAQSACYLMTKISDALSFL